MYLIGIEIGTTRLKTGVYDSLGNQLYETTRNYNLFFDEKTNMAEADPHEWWKAVIFTLKKALSKIDKKKVRAICVGSHGPSLVALDKNKKVVANSIIWLDKRAFREAEFISGRVSGKSNDLNWFVPRALWMKHNKVELFTKVKHFLQPLDYINYKLTGNLNTTFVTDSIRIWNDDILEASTLDVDLFPKQLKMGSIVGNITKHVADLTGLPEKVSVVAGTGGADFVEILISSGALKTGIVCDRGGTSQGINLCWKKPFNNKIFFEAPHPFVPKAYHISGLMAATGKSLQWYKELFYGRKTSYDKFFKDAENSSVGANKLIYLPYLSGERTPWWDVNARGVFFGLSLEHKEKDIVRAILEGVGFGIAHIINLFKQHGATVSEVRALGGQARSPLWNQIKADITNLPFVTTKVPDGATLGLAIIAGMGVKLYNSITEGAKDIVKSDKVFLPNKINHEIYSQMQIIYEDLYPSLKKNFTKLSNLRLQQTEDGRR